MNKEEEKEFINHFKGNYPNFPNGEIIPSEKPDFIIKNNTEVYGLEITKIFKKPESNKPPKQSIESC